MACRVFQTEGAAETYALPPRVFFVFTVGGMSRSPCVDLSDPDEITHISWSHTMNSLKGYDSNFENNSERHRQPV